MNTEGTVKSLIRSHDTNNPFKIASELHIIILYEDLGKYRGYYNRVFRQKFIHINENLNEREALITCAHELGHAILHAQYNTPFMRSNTFYSISKFEKQANQFAANLLISDAEIREHQELDISQLAGRLDLPIELVKLKLNIY